MSVLSERYAKFLDACGTLAGLVVAAMAALVSVDVLIRNLGIGTFPWLLEVAEYALFVSTFVAAPWVLHLGAHVRVDLLLTAVPRAVARVLEVAVDILGLAVSVTLLYYGLLAAADAFRIGSLIFKELVVPEWWLLSVIPASTFLLSLEFVLRLLRMGAPAPESPEQGPPERGL